MATKQDIDIDDDKKQGIVDYLQAPKKKRRNFIILAVGKNFDSDIGNSLEIFVKQNFKNYAVALPKNEKELHRYLSRQIVILIIDDNYLGLNKTIELIGDLKAKKSQQGTPVLFLTNDSKKLIQEYHDKLALYQEGDNYLEYNLLSLNQIYAHVRAAVSQPGARKSRRFNIDVPVEIYYLTNNKKADAKIKNISLHGCVVQVLNTDIFHLSDQLQIRFPIKVFIPHHPSDFIKISAKVRRVFMEGNKAAISWEYVSDEQYLMLTKLVLSMVNKEITKFHQQKKIRAINFEKRS